MRDKILNACLLGAVFIFIGFLLFASTKISLNFDASYNLLSYQSLFNGTGFAYTYNGITIPFDPVISTGPELYVPAFLLWKITGTCDYFSAVHVLIGLYAAFLLFLVFYVHRRPVERMLSLGIFLFWIFYTGYLWGENACIVLDPLGEVVAAFLVCAGFYFLHRARLFAGFLLLGFALDAKTNIIIALVPAAGLYILIRCVWPYLRARDYGQCLKKCITVVPYVLLMFAPHFLYSTVVPALVLDPAGAKVLQAARAERADHLLQYGFGQAVDLYKNPTRAGLADFFDKTKGKAEDLQYIFGGSWLCLLLYAATLVAMLVYARGHFAFYLFFFSLVMLVWYLTMPFYGWLRYFFMSEVVFILGLCAFLPSLAGHRHRVLLMMLIAVVVFSLPRFSAEALRATLRGDMRRDLLLMTDEIRDIDEKKMYAYGWLQCPQLMLLSGKRFQNLFDPRHAGRIKGSEAYFLTSYENKFMGEDVLDSLTKNYVLVAEHGHNRLYRLQ